MTFPIPKYVVLRNVLLERFREFRPGDRVPSENTLAQQFGVSRVTLQRALSWLVHEGVIIRHQGKGTFYVGRDQAKGSHSLSGALESLMVYEDDARARVVEKAKWVQASPEVRRQLKLSASDGVVVIKRVALSRGKPLIYIVNYLSDDLGAKVYEDDRDLERFPLVSLLREKYRVSLTRATQTIEAVLADSEIAKHLAASIGSALLLAERTYFSGNDQPILFTRSWYRSDRFKYTVTLRDWKQSRWRRRAKKGRRDGA